MSARVMDKNSGLMKTTAGATGRQVVDATASPLQHQQQQQSSLNNQNVDWIQHQPINGQNLMVVSQDPQGKELISVADEQAANGVNVVLDSYC